MAIALAIFGVTFAAFCVWLGVRIVNRRKKPGVAFWATVVVVVVLVGYPLSWGPVCRLVYDDRCPNWAMTVYSHFYEPIFVINRNSETAYSVSHRYLVFWGAESEDDLLIAVEHR